MNHFWEKADIFLGGLNTVLAINDARDRRSWSALFSGLIAALTTSVGWGNL